ncbi:hypothetical protein AC579_9952 [Pseudocercospora musae]|uniref:ER membrane protein complex subunit 7 beta-sandwich domain-containing protein n=1 Tax=Pseudocercospora musae TaxID=113226 RepID=A0A139ILL5_9PEZI|nr:hypothetical protein AC579_9952 [Pseudocercospora musae]
MANVRPAMLLAIATIASAAKLIVSIPPSQLLENPNELPASTHAVLLGPPGIRYDAPLRRDSTFVFSHLSDASYLLTLHSRDFFFPPLRVDVTANPEENAQNISAWQTFRGNEWSNKGQSFGEGKDELRIDVRPGARKDFYQQRGGFNLLGFLKSPMILMALFSVVMIFGLPYLMDNMDPEAKAEFEEMSKKSPLMGSSGAASQMQNFDLAGFLAGRSNAPAEQPAPAASGGKKR